MKRCQINRLFVTTVCIIGAIAFAGSCGSPSGNKPTNVNVNSVASNANTTAAKLAPVCAAGDDKRITDEIRVAFAKDAGLKQIPKQVNFYVKDCVVYLVGWTDNFDNFKAAEDLSLAVTGVLGTNSKNLWLDESDAPKAPSGGCTAPLVRCGELCVEPGTCNISSDPPADPGNSNSPPKPKNTNSGGPTPNSNK